MRWFGRRRLPADRRPDLARDERVIAWASTAADSVVVVTNLGLWLPSRDRLGWNEINKATWSGTALTVVPGLVIQDHGEYEETADAPAVALTLREPDRVPEHVRTRVTRSVAYTRHHPLPGGGVRVAARRVPGLDGLRWTARYDPGTPAAPETVGQLVAQGIGETVVAPG